MRVFNSAWFLQPVGRRFDRRYFQPLEHARKVQDRLNELYRILKKELGLNREDISYQANQRLMRIMVRECRRPTVRAVHAYEDCSLWQFQEARRLGKACIYDLPTSYYLAWQRTQIELERKYYDWLPAHGFGPADPGRLEQKHQELELADVILVPSSFVKATVCEFFSSKQIVLAPYGVDAEFWTSGEINESSRPLRFLYAGNLSVRKGVPLLIEAWSKAGLRDAQLELVGSWQLAESRRGSLPPGITWHPACAPRALRDRYRGADVFVFPSFSEGLALVLLEAMACGLPAIASQASGGPEIMGADCGRVFGTGDLDALVELLRWFVQHQDKISSMSRAAKVQAQRCTWKAYRAHLTRAVSKFL
jgi:glycosyltransferase involved in cell wall biosynthesis